MKKGLRRICAFLLALMVLVTTCFADLPDGSLSFLGDVGEQIVSMLSNDQVEAAAASTKFSLTTAYGSATISEIKRYSEGMWFFDCKSDTGSEQTVFCMNSGKSLSQYDTYKYTKVSASSYSNQSLAKAMTWWFGETSRGCMNEGGYNNGSSYGSLTANQTHAAVQAYVWAACTSGASKETTVKQVLQNYCGLSSGKAGSYAKSIVNAISGTYVYGYIYYYTLSSCGHSSKKDADKHQTMLSWSGGTIVKTGTYSASDKQTGSLTITVEIEKKDKTTSKLIDTAVFKATYAGKLLKNASSVSISNGSITSAKVSVTTGSYNADTSKFTTSGGKIKFTFTVNYTTSTYTTKTYKYVKNWNELDYWTQQEYTQAGYYQSEALAKSAAQNELKSGLSKYVTNVSTAIRGKTIKVEETSAPKGHGYAATSTLSKTAKDSLRLTYSFTNTAKYGKVTVIKTEGASTGYDVDGATLKGAVYGVYANQTIYDTDNKTVLYKKDALIAKITTDSNGKATSKTILPVGYKYYVKEIEASEGYSLDTAKHTFTISLNSDGSVESATVSSVEDHETEPKYGAVSLLKSAKRDESYIGDDATLQNAVYYVYAAETIYDENGKKIFSAGDKIKYNGSYVKITTDKYGYGKSAEGIPAGDDSNGYKYYLLESTASTGYVLDTTKHYFYVRVNSSGTVTVKDKDGNAVNGSRSSGKYLASEEDSVWGKLNIYKYTEDEDGTKNVEKNAVFVLVKASAVLSATGKSTNAKASSAISKMTESERESLVNTIKKSDASAILTTLTTNSKGYASYSPVPMGTYFLIQTSGDTRYKLTQKYFSVKKGSGTSNTFTYEMVDEINPAYIQITKTKSYRDSSGALIEEEEQGAVFYVLYASKVTKTDAQLNAMSASERQSYVSSLGSSAVKVKLTTDENGEASALVTPGEAYVILQTSGDPYCELAYVERKTFAENENVTYYYEATNPEDYSVFSITKTLADQSGQSEGAEAEAVFVVVKASYVTKSAEELNAMTTSERVEYVETLENSNSSCILATLTTDEDGCAAAYWRASEYEGDFVVIQLSGTEGYALMPVQYSAAATSDGSNGTVLKKETGTDADGLGYTNYSFSYADVWEGTTDFSITKKLSDIKGNDAGAEEGAVFVVLKASCVDKSADEINEMESDARQEYVEALKAADSSCIIAELTTSSEGEASASWTNQDYDGDFVVIQTEGESGYALMPVLYSADATETGLDGSGNPVLTRAFDGRTTSYSFSYVDAFADWGKIAVQKKYETGNGVWQDESGAEFTVLDETGQEVAWITTDSTGYGVAVDAAGSEAALPFGTYYVRQTASGTGADNTDFMDDELVILTKSEREQTVLFEAKNPAKDYKLTVTKLSDDTGAPVANATYTIKAAEDILAEDGSVEHAKGDTTATIVTDANGEGTTWIPYGYYYIEESESPYEFVKSTEKVYFTVDASGITVTGGKTSSATSVTETDDDGNEFTYYAISYTTYDTPVYGTIYVTKDGRVVEGLASEGGFVYTSEYLEGAVFALYARNDITDDAGNVIWKAGSYISSATTDKTGTAQFYWDKDGDGTAECVDFYLGDYYVVETYAPDGYVCDGTEHNITLTWDKTPSKENELAEAGSVGDTGESFGSDISYESSGKYVLETGSALNARISDAVTVTFTWSSPASGTRTTDVSHDQDGSVVLWNDGSGNYYISTCDNRQAVIFNGDSSHMFDSCKSLTEIRFDSVDTSQVCDMSYMFYMCTLLTELDLTDFDTTNVGYFDYMFCGCSSLETIYAQEPDGSSASSLYSTTTWTTGVTAAASGAVTEGAEITWADFSYTRLYTADYIAEEVQESITLSASDIASVSPSVASQGYLVEWVDEDTYTMEVQITLSEDCAYYCTDGSYNNTMTAVVTVEIPGEVDIETDENPMVQLALSDTPITVSIEVYKEDGSGNAVAGAVFTLYANCDIKNADGEVIIKAGEAIMESETLGEDAPVLTFSGLPTNLYAVEGTYLSAVSGAVYCYADGTTGSKADGESMFYVKETTVPAGYQADSKTYYLTGALSDYEDGWTDENGDGVITYTFTAINTELTYLTLQKVWDDSGSAERPEYVVFRAKASGKTTYIIVLYEDKAYLFANSGVGAMIYSVGVTSASYLDSALCYWNVTVSTETHGSTERTVWSVVLNKKFTKVSASSFSSPFTASSGYTFTENATLLKSMTVNASGSQYYTVDSAGYTTMSELVWRTTNSLPDDVTDSAVTKYWDDNENEQKIRPTSISVTLCREDSKGNTKQMFVRTLSEENNWSYSTTEDSTVTLDKYDSYGKEYSYYWVESESSLTNGYILSDTKTDYDENANTWYTSLTNSLISISVEKIWEDEDDVQGIRPDSVYMKLYADGVWVDVEGNAVTDSTTADTAVELNAENEWKAALTGLPKYDASGNTITYTFREVTSAAKLIVNGKTVLLTDDDLSWHTGDKETGYRVSYSQSVSGTTVTNTHKAGGEVTVTKKILAGDIDWTEGEPSFTFTLTASNGASTNKTLTFTESYVAANTDVDGYVTISATFAGLSYGTYTLEETDMPDGWEFVSLETTNGTVRGQKASFTISESNLRESFTAVFENEFSREGAVTVYKKILADEIDWDKGEPEFTFEMTASDLTSQEKTITITQEYANANVDADGYVVAYATFRNLAYDTYTLEETDMPDNWEFVSLTSSTGTVSGKSVTFVISKTNAKTEFEATYVNQYNRPGDVTVYKRVLAEEIDWSLEEDPAFTFTLTASDGTKQSQTVTFTEDYVSQNTDTDGYVKLGTTFTDLAYGTYTLEETQMPQYWTFVSLTCSRGTVSGETATFTISRENAWTELTAIYTDEFIREGKITIRKYESDGTTPLEGVTFAISNEDGELVDTQTTDENGEVTFDELPLGTYRICETATVSGYSLLAKEITATIPLELTQDEIDDYEAQGIYVNTANASVRNGEYYFYELTYEVKNTWNFDMPLSGAGGTMSKGLFLMALLMILAALLTRKSKNSCSPKLEATEEEISGMYKSARRCLLNTKRVRSQHASGKGRIMEWVHSQKNLLLFLELWSRMGLLYSGGQRYFGRFNRRNKKKTHFCHYFTSGCG